MIKYIANQEIGDYHIGQEVPEKVAKVWLEMYDIKPVDLIDDKIDPKLDLNKDGKVDEKDKQIANNTASGIRKVLKSKR